jgi:hypothetical protein
VETSETDSVTGDAATSSSDVTKMEEGGAQQVRYGRLCNLKCVASSSRRTPYWRMSTIDLLVLTSLDHPLLVLKILLFY